MTQSKGTCRICGNYDVLTSEHVPPKKAFNNHKYMVGLMNDDDPLGEPIKKIYRQGGISFKTLCPRCNNNTGSWYANAYISWCFLGFDILKLTKGKSSLFYINSIYPLQVLKQIIVMFFSINDKDFRTINPYLEKFVMDKNAKHLPPDYRVYTYFNLKGNPRYLPISTVGQFSGERKISTFTEFTYPPYGFVLTVNKSPAIETKFREITHFADYSYNTKWDFDLDLKSLETWLPIPGDYRTYEKIQADLSKDNKNGS